MDINNDGKLDLVAGDTEGNVWFFKNVGTQTAPKLAEGVKFKSDGKEITGTAPNYEIADKVAKFKPTPGAIMGIYSKLNVADWDGDGLLDILVGHESPRSSDEQIMLYRNLGPAKDPKFAAPVPLKIIKDQSVPRPSPYVVDWDGDGLKDVLLGTETDQVLFLRNTGTAKAPTFAKPEPIKLVGLSKCYRCRVTVADWNNDGKLDLLVGTFYSGESPSENKMGGNVWLFLRK